MKKKTTLSDVARACGVSTGTVSLALNDSPLTSEKTKELVKETAASMGYIPNETARALVKRRSRKIGAVVPDLLNPFYATFIGELNRAVSERGYSLSITLSDNSTQTEGAMVEQMLANNVEGLIIVPVNRENATPDYVKSLSAQGIPFLFAIDRYENTDAPCIASDCREGMRSMLRHLVERGYRDVAYLSGDASAPTLRERLEGYRQVMEQNGLSSRVISVPSIDYTGATLAVEQCIRENALPKAFVCPNDMMALGAINALQSKGLRVPEDCAVTGFDDLIFSRLSSVPITTISQDVALLAQTSADTVLSLIEGAAVQAPPLPQKTKLIIRRSC